MLVLVTGATGFLGGHLVTALGDRGHEVRALSRPGSDASGLESRGVAVARASYDDPDALGGALEGVDAIVHAAGGGRMQRPGDAFRANAETTHALLAAALDAAGPPKRFVLVSSLAAHGPAREGRPADETSPEHPESEYGRSKRSAERSALALASRLAVTVVRPPAVYGPGDDRMLPLFRAATRGVVPMVAPEGTLSLIHGRDCADAVGTVLDTPHPSGRVYFVSNPEPVTRRELAQAVGRSVGRDRVRVLPVPSPVLTVAALGAEAFGRLTDRSVFLSRDKVRDVRQAHQSCDPSRIGRELDWRARMPLEEGLAETAAWYRAEGLL